MAKKQRKENISEKQEEEAIKKSIASLIVNGDVLTTSLLKRQAGLIVLITFFMMVYIYNGYSSRKQQIQIAKLKTELDDARYNSIIRSSELLEKSRQSRVEQYIHEYEDTSIQAATTPPFLIK